MGMDSFGNKTLVKWLFFKRKLLICSLGNQHVLWALGIICHFKAAEKVLQQVRFATVSSNKF